MAQHAGTVKWFNNGKGPDLLSHEGGADVFVRHSALLLDGYKSL